MKNKKGITLIALIITIIVMLILVGVTVTVSINGGLFEKTKEAAKGTTSERTKEQIMVDVAVEMADKAGEKLTKDELKAILVPKYGKLNDDETALILNNGEEIPLSEIDGSQNDGPQKNEYGYYTNCLYGTEYIDNPGIFTKEQLEKFNEYYQTRTPVYYAWNIAHKYPTVEWKKNSKLEDYDIAEAESICILFKENSFTIFWEDGSPSKEINLVKENGRIYYGSEYTPFFFSEDGKTVYMYNEGS